MGRLGKFLKLSRGERRAFVEAALWLAVFRGAVFFMPFKSLAGRLGKHMAETAFAPLDAAARGETKIVSRAVQTLGRRLPWKCTCLVQAAAGKRMLDRRRIPATLYLGAAQEGDRGLIAHAWLRSGDMIVTGGAGKDRFTVVSTFA